MTEICRVSDCYICDRTPPIHVAHQICWDVATAAGKTQASLLDYAANTTPVLLPQFSAYRDSDLTFPSGIRAKTPLGELLRGINSRLPVELHYEIAKNLHGHIMHSILRASEIARTTRGEHTSSDHETEMIRSSGPIRSLSIKTRSVFGLYYISEIGFNSDQDDSIPTDITGVHGIRVATGRYGIRAMKVLFVDGSESRWLGDTRHCWYSETYHGDLRRLLITSDASLTHSCSLKTYVSYNF